MIKPQREYDFPVVRDGIHRNGAEPIRARKPDWLKVSLPSGIEYGNIK